MASLQSLGRPVAWMLFVYEVLEDRDLVVVVTVRDARSSRSPTMPGSLMAWRLRSGHPVGGLVFPLPDRAGRQHDWLNWNRRIWTPVAPDLGIHEPPYTLRHSYASLRMREGVSIRELA